MPPRKARCGADHPRTRVFTSAKPRGVLCHQCNTLVADPAPSWWRRARYAVVFAWCWLAAAPHRAARVPAARPVVRVVRRMTPRQFWTLVAVAVAAVVLTGSVLTGGPQPPPRMTCLRGVCHVPGQRP
jgi:hypothetical protein